MKIIINRSSLVNESEVYESRGPVDIFSNGSRLGGNLIIEIHQNDSNGVPRIPLVVTKYTRIQIEPSPNHLTIDRLATLESTLRKIIAIPLGPDKGSGQSQIDCAVAYAKSALDDDNGR